MHFTTGSFFHFIPYYKWSYFPSLVKNHQISAWGCLENVANKKRRVPSKKKLLVKKFSTRKINFQLAKFSF